MQEKSLQNLQDNKNHKILYWKKKVKMSTINTLI
jgi:hypothetical protein